MSQQAEHRIGNVIGGKWRVDALLGSGSMAAVYAVTHRNGARAALKILHPTLCADPGVCERFLGEGYLTNSVKHVGIVRVLDDGVTDDGCVFLVMDLLDGLTLEALRQERGGQIDVRETLDIADKLMDVLHAVHQAGIVHRDLKPQNVFVCDDGSVKLLDFGVARVLDSGAQSKLSVFGLVLGTPSFMSPEQAIGARDKVDHRTDIWSLGATLFTSLTGQTVHLGPNPQARLLAAAKMNARSISMVKQDLPPTVAAAIDMALRFRKEDRWQNVDAFRRAFREASIGLGWTIRDSQPEVASWLRSQEASAFVDFTGPSAPPEHGGDLGRDNGERALALLVRARSSEAEPDSKAEAAPRPAPAAPVEDVAFQSTTQRMIERPAFVRPPMASAPEGSYPAASSTLEPAGIPAERGPSRVGVWVVALVLAAVAASGIAFFAAKRGGVSAVGSGRSATAADPPGTIATAPLPPPPPIVPPPKLEKSSENRGVNVEVPPPAEAGSAAAPAPPSARTTRAGTAETPGAQAAQAPPVSLPRSPSGPKALPVPKTSARSEQALPPDPFGTPE